MKTTKTGSVPVLDPELSRRYQAAGPFEVFTVAEAGAILRLPAYAVNRAAQRGELRRVAISERTFRYTKQAIEDYVRALSPIG